LHDALPICWHINTVNVRIFNHWGCRSKEYFLRTRITSHLDNFITGCTTYNRIIYQQYILTFKLKLNRVEFLAYRFFTQLLSRHNEGTTNVTVFHETFTEFYPQHIGKFER